MKNTDIKAVRWNNDEVSALYLGSTLLFQKNMPVTNNILAGSFIEPGNYTYKYNMIENREIPLNDDLTFSVEVKGIESCNRMFYNNQELETITSMPYAPDTDDLQYMFYSCKALTSADLSNMKATKGKITDMMSMFNNCSVLTSVDLTNINTTNVKSMQQTFEYCKSLSAIDLSEFDTSNVESMMCMFSNCESLTSLNLMNFKTSKVTTFNAMFLNCTKLNSLRLNFDFSGVLYGNIFNMFKGCTSLTTVIGTTRGIKDNLSLSDSQLTSGAAMVFIDGLENVTTKKTLTLKKFTFNYLNQSQLATATSKGWTVASV